MDAAAIITSARTRARLSKRELARRVGTSPAAIVEYESGRRSPTVESLDHILRACGFDLTIDLVSRKETDRLIQRGRELESILSLVDAVPHRWKPTELEFPVFPQTGKRDIQ
jgi:transcriptional regulator with XRE-family HTH domain